MNDRRVSHCYLHRMRETDHEIIRKDDRQFIPYGNSQLAHVAAMRKHRQNRDRFLSKT